MRKIAFITALLAALAAAVPASGAVMLAKSCGNSCATLTAGGTGSLGVVGSGAEWGSVGSGIIWIRDRTGKSNAKNWVHGSGIHWKSLGDDGWRATSSKSMTFSANSKFWVKLQGPKISMSGVFDGTGNIKGNGKYTLNGHKRSWPNTSQALRF
jgi:hypothetical protein